jgi:hypothetical protein
MGNAALADASGSNRFFSVFFWFPNGVWERALRALFRVFYCADEGGAKLCFAEGFPNRVWESGKKPGKVKEALKNQGFFSIAASGLEPLTSRL